MSRTHGRVKWFDEQKGFGIICAADGRHVFVHYSVAGAANLRALREGDAVEFDCEASSYGLMASRVEIWPSCDRQAVGGAA